MDNIAAASTEAFAFIGVIVELVVLFRYNQSAKVEVTVRELWTI